MALNLWQDPFGYMDDDWGLMPFAPRRTFAPLANMQRQLAQMQHAMNDGVRVVYDKDKFAVQMDVSQYAPEEVDVKVHDEDKKDGAPAYLVISGKHEERQDEHGFVSRSFTRRYAIPDDVDAKALQCNLSNHGVLSLQAPRKAIEGPSTSSRAIPITHVSHAPHITGGSTNQAIAGGNATNGGNKAGKK